MKVFKFLLFVTILAFLALFYAYSNGYYERLQNDKVILTNQKIEEFENNLKNGKDITIEDYMVKDKSYSTKTSELSLKVSDKASNLLDSVIKFLFQKLGSVVE